MLFDQVMNNFLTSLEAEFTSFETHKLLEQLVQQIHDVHIPGNKAMLPGYLSSMPSGEEVGTYLALDLGGSNFRAALICLPGNRDRPQILRLHSWTVPEEAKVSTSDKLFDWIAQCVRSMLDNEDSLRSWVAGFAFSFPVLETGVNTGHIMTMGKGFTFKNDVTEKCIKAMLDEAFQRNNLQIRLVAIINDTLASLYSLRYRNSNVVMSLIIGTGCNSTILCKRSIFPNAKLRNSPRSEASGLVAVNTEMSMFGSGILPRTKYDAIVDQSAAIPGFQPYEQMISGLYIHELTRLIILDAIISFGFLSGKVPASLAQPMSFTAYLDAQDNLNARELLDAGTAVGEYSDEEIAFILQVRRIVIKRSAILAAVALAAMVRFIPTQRTNNDEPPLCACDGGLIEKSLPLKHNCEKTLQEMGCNVRLVLSSHGSLTGAAVAAAHVLQRYEPEVSQHT